MSHISLKLFLSPEKKKQHLPTDLCKKAYSFQWLMSTVLETNKLHSSEMFEITRAWFRCSISCAAAIQALKLLAAPRSQMRNFSILKFFQRKHQSNAIDLRSAARHRELILTSYEKFIKANPQFVLAGMSKTSEWYKQVVFFSNAFFKSCARDKTKQMQNKMH